MALKSFVLQLLVTDLSSGPPLRQRSADTSSPVTFSFLFYLRIALNPCFAHSKWARLGDKRRVSSQFFCLGSLSPNCHDRCRAVTFSNGRMFPVGSSWLKRLQSKLAA